MLFRDAQWCCWFQRRHVSASCARHCSPCSSSCGCEREKVRPARLKTAFFDHFGLAGRAFSRTGHSHVATLKPMTPLQPLTRASMKPPSPLLTPDQQPLKPTTPQQPKNAPKTPISRPQRRRRFQLAHLTGPQRRRRFQTTRPPGRQGQAAAPVGNIRYKRRQTNAIPIASRGPLLQTSSICVQKP